MPKVKEQDLVRAQELLNDDFRHKLHDECLKRGASKVAKELGMSTHALLACLAGLAARSTVMYLLNQYQERQQEPQLPRSRRSDDETAHYRCEA